jgi:hypothetical protein
MNDATSLQAAHAQPGHETTDVSSRGIIVFIVSMAIAIVAITGILWLFFGYLTVQQAKVDQSRFPLASEDRARLLKDRLPPDPRLEGLSPNSAIRSGVAGWPSLGPAQLERDRQALDSYAWVDVKAGIVQVPIDRAIELLAGKLPVRKAGGAP